MEDIFSSRVGKKMQADNALENSKNKSMFSSTLAGGANMLMGAVNANILMGNFEAMESSADAIQLQALEMANNLREKFISAVGDYTYSSARRGIKTNSKSVTDNIQRSSEALGKDISRTKDNAKAKADKARSKAKYQKHMAGASILDGLSKGFTRIGEIE